VIISNIILQALLAARWRAGLAYANKCASLAERHLGAGDGKTSFPPPPLELVEAQVAIWKCMWLKIGNMKRVKMT